MPRPQNCKCLWRARHSSAVVQVAVWAPHTCPETRVRQPSDAAEQEFMATTADALLFARPKKGERWVPPGAASGRGAAGGYGTKTAEAFLEIEAEEKRLRKEYDDKLAKLKF